jgi:hypothetical protein
MTDFLLYNIKNQFAPERKLTVSTTKPNQLLLFWETVTAYCNDYKEHKIHSVGRMQGLSMLKQVVHIVTT